MRFPRPRQPRGACNRATTICRLSFGPFRRQRNGDHAGSANCRRPEVSEAFYLDDDTVRTWLKCYRAGGLDKLTLFDWHGRPGHMSREQEAELSAYLGAQLYRDTGEVAAHIRAAYGIRYSHSGCIKHLRRLVFEYKC